MHVTILVSSLKKSVSYTTLEEMENRINVFFITSYLSKIIPK